VTEALPAATGRPAPRLVLSTGRTGSTLLREHLRRLALPLEIAFEPPPSRSAYLLRNAAAAGALPRALAHRHFLRAMRSAWAATPPGRLRIEMHAYLAPMVTELAAQYEPLRIAHLVRHPLTWIPSIANFKAAGWRRSLVDLVPYARQVHPAARRRWPRLEESERNAWRWRYTNECILALAEQAQAYALVRCEDLLSGDDELAGLALGHVLAPLLEPLTPPGGALPRERRLNASHGGGTPPWQRWPRSLRASVLAICAPVMPLLGYEDEPP